MIFSELEVRRSAGIALETHASKAVEAIPGADLRRRGNAPTFALYIHAAMTVPGPGLGNQNEAVASVAKVLLQKRADVGGDGIGCNWRIAVVQHARDCAWRSQFGAPQREIERPEVVVRID